MLTNIMSQKLADPLIATVNTVEASFAEHTWFSTMLISLNKNRFKQPDKLAIISYAFLQAEC